MRMYDIIAKKRDSFELSDEEIEFFVQGCTSGEIPDYQIASLLMAVYLNGMSDRELTTLTLAMKNSGECADLSGIKGITVDKHSTGGVGDKTTLIVVPIAAALGAKVAKMSGRGLGHTGGTIDKLEAIEGFKTELSPAEFESCVNTVGACVIGQSGNLAPADKKIYALRDVTATVSSIPLIASSIMSKKLAAGSDCIVLDVKTGSGAFMKTPKAAEQLAQKMVEIGSRAGKKVSAVITDMSTPLGFAVGNSLEVIEAIRVLRGELKGDLYEVCIELAANMVMHTNGKSLDECRTLAAEAISNGSAYNKLKQIVSAQGGSVQMIENTDMFPKAKYFCKVLCQQSGYIAEMNSEKIGNASVMLGAGRQKKGDRIDFTAGIILLKKTGDYVQKGEAVAELYANDNSLFDRAECEFMSGLTFSDDKPKIPPLIYKTV